MQREIYDIKHIYDENEKRDKKTIIRDVLLQNFVIFRYSHQKKCYIACRIKFFIWFDIDHMHNFENICFSIIVFDFLFQKSIHFARKFRYLLQLRTMLLVRWFHRAIFTNVFRHSKYVFLFQIEKLKRFNVEFVIKILRKTIMNLKHFRRT